MAEPSTVTHRALDGVAYTLSGDLDLTRPATSVAEVVAAGRVHEFTMGIDSLGDDLAAALGIDEFDSELSFNDGVLRTAVTTEYDPQTQLVEHPLLVVWQGKHHCLVTRLYRASVSDALGLLRTLGIREEADGLSLTPDASAGTVFAGPATIIKEVPRLGLLEMAAPTAEQTAQLPPWKGVPVSGGELYRDTLADGRPFFVLSTQEVWATLVPLADAEADDVPTLAERLTLRLAE
ncbi:hypothetical protein [Stackebrandtia soli]|uniref:hypothetical protein n=1 Tax=Stackebrandtia soli TaxID=1892856 RepID=UPI0039EA55FB